MSSEPRTPRATYRLQLRPGFGFDDAAAVAPYLARLGISHVYVSPPFQAAPGSTHGYDVVDHGRVNEDLGGAEAFARLTRTLAEHAMGLVVDIVPNHMSIATRDNVWWWDVLENGPASRYAHFFDVDWDPHEERLRDKVLLPILGEHYGRMLEAGDIRIAREGGSFTVRVHDHVLPVAPISLHGLLARASEESGDDELGFLGDAVASLPSPSLTDDESLRRRHRDKAVVGRYVLRLFAERPESAAAVDDTIGRINAEPDELHAMLEGQNYRLAFWRAARHDLDYRRFFDIDTLAALRMDHEEVFEETHRLVLEWVQQGLADGLRVDHPDGLRDPEGYLRRLRRAAPRAWIVVEKILEREEELPPTWPVDGATGYSFLNVVGGLFVDPAGAEPLRRVYAELCGQELPELDVLVRDKKRMVVRELLGSDLNRLTSVLVRVCERHRRYRDFTREELREALAELITCLPVYRTYVRQGEMAQERDVAYIQAAVDQAARDRPELDRELLGFLRELLCGRVPGELEADLVDRFQQLCGPAMAKGMEDTAFYCYPHLLSLNEVGGAPDRFGTSVEELHAFNQRAQTRWPRAMLATSTHDTKRSEDARVRLSLLSEIPDRWRDAVQRWSRLAARHRGGERVDRPTEYTIYQTLVAAWPLSAERLLGYLEKAGREAKERTSWTRVDAEYEAAVAAFARGLLEDRELVADLEAFLASLLPAARVSSLTQTLIKLTSPGVPDFYQGCELWDESLTDPDNRRPIDFELRARLVAEAERMGPDEVLARADGGLPKLWLIRRVLELRRARPEWFGADAGYQPLAASGRHAARVVAFVRAGSLIVVAPCRVLGLERGPEPGWGDTALALPAGRWTRPLGGAPLQADEGGAPVPLQKLLEPFPVCVLAKEEVGP